MTEFSFLAELTLSFLSQMFLIKSVWRLKNRQMRLLLTYIRVWSYKMNVDSSSDQFDEQSLSFILRCVVLDFFSILANLSTD